ncbi:hypothetical protein V6N11_008666 [Hibiscus sabdariffa]|uniref:LisH domain-containing protein n=1 Tax=Hibiscus sabdariffa TaxID=183260 RepID=A0ABR2PPF6_9ROSI
MTEPSSVDAILEFLRRNGFTRAEAALRSDLGNRPNLNGFLQKLALEEKDSGKVLEEEKGKKHWMKVMFYDEETNNDNRSKPDQMEDEDSFDSDSHLYAVWMGTSQVNLDNAKIDNLKASMGNGELVETVVSVND